MKNILFVFLLATSLVAFGQNGKRKMKVDKEFTPEQQAILKTKKMVLALDLNESQQSQVLALHKNWIQEKSTTKAAHKSLTTEEMTSDQKFEMMNARLDTKIDHQQELKKVLNKDQYELWKESITKMKYRSKSKGNQGQRKHHSSQKN